jgi:hypothetical protein
VARVYPERESKVVLPLQPVGAVQSALAVGGCGCEIFVLATWPLQFVKPGAPRRCRGRRRTTRQMGSRIE